jgi:hypothetical protein
MSARSDRLQLSLALSIEPRLHAKEHLEPKRGVRCGRALPDRELADPARRDVDVRRALARANADGLLEILRQDLAGIDVLEQIGQASNSQ